MMDSKTITQIQHTTEELLQKMDISAEVTVEVDQSAVVQINIKSTEADVEQGVLIGRHGETLHALQLVLSLIVNQSQQEWVQLMVDVDGYRQRREEQLIALANRTAEKVLYLNEPIALNPMPPIDRRIIHMALAENNKILSESTGKGKDRKIVVSPAA